MTPLLFDICIKATVLLVVAAVIDAALRQGGSAAVRHLTWAISLVALLALPIAAVAMPRWIVRIPVAAAAMQAPVASELRSVAPDTFSRGTAAACGEPALSPCAIANDIRGAGEKERVTGWTVFAVLAALAALYAAGVILLLIRLVIEPFALRRMARASRELTDDGRPALVADASRDMGVTSFVRLLRSTREVMPLTFGTLRPTIILPASATTWTTDRRRAVLLHELAHVVRRDCLVQRIAAVVRALYWPHPGVWWAIVRLRTERELACDDRVLAAGAGAREYAGHLLDLAHSLSSPPAPATALGMARARRLESRLLAVLDTARNRAAIRPRAWTIGAAVAIAFLMPLAALRAAVVPGESSLSVMVPGESSLPVRGGSSLLLSDGPSMPVRALRATRAIFQATSQDLAGTWDLRLSRDGVTAQVTVRTEHGTHGRSVRIDQLPITADQLSSPSANVAFPIRREAGTFHIEGVCHRGMCGGTYSFEPSQTFAAELGKRGLARPTPQDQMELAMADIGVAYLDELSKNGYAKPDLADLVRAARHGVDTEYLRGMSALGEKVGTLDALIRLRDHGVDPTYIRGMAETGFPRLTVDQLLTARDHGVDPAYVKGMRDLGYRIDALDALVRLRDHGIDPSYAHGMADAGFPRLTVDELLTARDHGIDPAYVDGLASLGYKALTVDALLRARDHGVDPRYIRGLAELGYKDVALTDLIRLRDHGVDAAYVRRIQQRGLSHLSVDELIHRRDRGEENP